MLTTRTRLNRQHLGELARAVREAGVDHAHEDPRVCALFRDRRVLANLFIGLSTRNATGCRHLPVLDDAQHRSLLSIAVALVSLGESPDPRMNRELLHDFGAAAFLCCIDCVG